MCLKWKTPFGFLILLAFVAAYEALECYDCLYVDGKPSSEEQEFFDESCKPGRTPSPSRAQLCEEKIYDPFKRGMLGVLNNTKHRFLSPKSKASLPFQTSNYSYTCVNLIARGRRYSDDSRILYSYRSCLRFEGMIPEQCYANKNDKIGDDIESDLFREIIVFLQLQFTDDTNIEVCSCNTDSCNASETVNKKIITLLLFVLTLHILHNFV